MTNHCTVISVLIFLFLMVWTECMLMLMPMIST
uniref:Uncharacterized protein n=1 Tax=Anguilla anguilla TaxID=7936 RepID=A0A0E9SNK6_ANGAN